MISKAFLLISVHFASISGNISGIGIHTLNGMTSMVVHIKWHHINVGRVNILEDARILEICLHIGFCHIARRIALPHHFKTLAHSVVCPILDENEQPQLVNDYVDFPVADILHLSGHVAPTCLPTIMEDAETLESMSSPSFACCFY
jgi:hypothetical protein